MYVHGHTEIIVSHYICPKLSQTKPVELAEGTSGYPLSRVLGLKMNCSPHALVLNACSCLMTPFRKAVAT